MRYRLPLLCCGLLLAVPAPGPLWAQGRGAIVGVVLSGRTLQPVAGARVRLIYLPTDSLVTAVSDSLGRFAFQRLAKGSYSIEAAFAEDRSMPSVIALGDRERVEVEFQVNPPRLGDSSVTVLPELEVEAEADPRGYLGRTGFNERRKTGLGQFLTRDEILERNPPTFFDLLRQLRGVEIVCTGRRSARNDCVPRMVRTRGNCPPLVLLDGMQVDVAAAQMATATELQGIEVYTGLSQAPLGLPGAGNALQANCGLIVIWTLHGPERRPR